MKDANFLTLFFARLTPRTGSFVYTSAGHETGYILDAADELKAELKSMGIPSEDGDRACGKRGDLVP
jgi:serine phosphatase RsbU (regulator of sigma subunit)